MKTSDLYNTSIADLHELKRQKWSVINTIRASDNIDEERLRKETENMAYIQKAIEDLEFIQND